jgi:hypothetical protein
LRGRGCNWGIERRPEHRCQLCGYENRVCGRHAGDHTYTDAITTPLCGVSQSRAFLCAVGYRLSIARSLFHLDKLYFKMKTIVGSGIALLSYGFSSHTFTVVPGEAETAGSSHCRLYAQYGYNALEYLHENNRRNSVSFSCAENLSRGDRYFLGISDLHPDNAIFYFFKYKAVAQFKLKGPPKQRQVKNFSIGVSACVMNPDGIPNFCFHDRSSHATILRILQLRTIGISLNRGFFFPYKKRLLSPGATGRLMVQPEKKIYRSIGSYPEIQGLRILPTAVWR